MVQHVNCLQAFAKIPDLVEHLRGLADKGLALGPLLKLVLPALAERVLEKKLYTKLALQTIKKLPLGKLQHSAFVTLLIVLRSKAVTFC